MTDMTQKSSAQLGPGGHWRNWVGNQSFIARHKAEPGSEDELAALVHAAAQQDIPVRVAGSGHSFTPVVATSGLLLSLKNMQGLVSVDLDRKRVVVRAGTRIGDIGRALKELRLSLANQGDIDTQAIAGALSTGTHGTGIALGCLSSQAFGMRLIQSDGSVFEVDGDRDPEMMAAAQVSVGMRSPLIISRRRCGGRTSSPASIGMTNSRRTTDISVSSGVRSPNPGASTACPTSPLSPRSSASTTFAR
jgi:FAD/FMN-containing dehydrogenase